ncbi:MAG: M23 family metallopeptidase [Vicinamibacterales bacterium]
MPATRYTVTIADRRSGVVHHFTIRLGPTFLAVCLVLALPVLIGFGAALKSEAEIAGLYTLRASLEIENASYRAVTEALAGQIQALQTTIADLGAKAALDPQLQSAMDKLPAVVKSRAMGGPRAAATLATVTPGLSSPEDTFGLLRDLLEGIESRLRLVRTDVDKRNALAAATPSIWPAHGWLSSAMGRRSDPFTGAPDYHPGLDISADRGTPVYATADGNVEQASYSGAYGNLVVLDHGYGLETRYGHLSSFRAKVGDRIKRGDVIGLVGTTGRSTSSHLHYEVRVNGRLLNPLQLLLGPRRANAN